MLISGSGDPSLSNPVLTALPIRLTLSAVQGVSKWRSVLGPPRKSCAQTLFSWNVSAQ